VRRLPSQAARQPASQPGIPKHLKFIVKTSIFANVFCCGGDSGIPKHLKFIVKTSIFANVFCCGGDTGIPKHLKFIGLGADGARIKNCLGGA